MVNFGWWILGGGIWVVEFGWWILGGEFWVAYFRCVFSCFGASQIIILNLIGDKKINNL